MLFLVRRFTIDNISFVLLRSVVVAVENVLANRCSFSKVEKMHIVVWERLVCVTENIH